MRQTDRRDADVASNDSYRVCAAGADRWDVYQQPRSRPVASFHDKAAALNYAMCLVRGRIAWHLLLRNEPGNELVKRAGSDDTNDTPAHH
jgi:hypothetical protein